MPPKETKETATAEKPESKVPLKKKVVKKKPLAEKNSEAKPAVEKKPVEVQEAKPEPSPPKVVERRRSRIFETAEKFQNLISASDSKPSGLEKPKKIIIPGVSVDGFKKEFERKASLTSPTSPPVINGKSPLCKKPSVEKEEAAEEQKPVDVAEVVKEAEKEAVVEVPEPTEKNEERKDVVKKAVSIISSALDKEGTRKSKSRPCMYRKPPVPFGSGGRSASGSIGMPLSPEEDKRFLKLQVIISTYLPTQPNSFKFFRLVQTTLG